MEIWSDIIFETVLFDFIIMEEWYNIYIGSMLVHIKSIQTLQDLKQLTSYEHAPQLPVPRMSDTVQTADIFLCMTY